MRGIPKRRVREAMASKPCSKAAAEGKGGNGLQALF